MAIEPTIDNIDRITQRGANLLQHEFIGILPVKSDRLL